MFYLFATTDAADAPATEISVDEAITNVTTRVTVGDHNVAPEFAAQLAALVATDSIAWDRVLHAAVLADVHNHGGIVLARLASSVRGRERAALLSMAAHLFYAASDTGITLAVFAALIARTEHEGAEDLWDHGAITYGVEREQPSWKFRVKLIQFLQENPHVVGQHTVAS